jgi:putative flippase GtrA
MNLPVPLEHLFVRLLAAWRERAVALKAVSFAVVGLINTAVDATVFFLLLGYVTSSLVIANVAAWVVANTGSYVMNSLTTFSSETDGKLRLKHYAAFAGSGLVAMTASTVTVVLAANLLPVWAAKAIAILASFVVNFTITHFVVFRPKGERADITDRA